MANIRLELPSEDIDFIFAVLTQTPLTYQRVAPVIDRIGRQVQAQAAAAHKQAACSAEGNSIVGQVEPIKVLPGPQAPMTGPEL